MAKDLSFGTDSKLQEQIAMLGEYLSENYEFRHNVLTDEYEIRELGSEPKPFRTFTREARNKLLRGIKSIGLDIPNVCQNVDEYVYSEDTPLFDPVAEWLTSLPAWDGKNHVGRMFERLPGITTEQQYFLAIWLRSAVAHWLGKDMLHGNEQVVTLVGAQGCGKSTFLASLLPQHLRNYYLDHINLGNKNDKEMALTNNLIVNIDELDQIRHGQQAELKQALSKIQVNGRPIYGRSQKCRKRFASFVATTNNQRPLNDPTGSRRFICIRIPDGQFIDNDTVIDYDQLYSQVVHELREKDMRYWFTNEESKRIEQLNQDFQRAVSLEDMIVACFRRPRQDEASRPLPVSDILATIASQFPSLQMSASTKVRLGMALSAMKFDRKHTADGSVYFLVPNRAA